MGDTSANPSYTPLTTNTSFVLSQLPALRALLDQLRSRMAALPKSMVGVEGDPKRAARREYIDSRTKLHLERTGGDRGGAGEEEQGAVVRGKRVGAEQVQTLESVLGLF